MPRFSIISPVYNTQEYLNKFIDSVLGQSFSDFELIIVDDGSTDKSVDICCEYMHKDERIKLLKQKNQGAGPARNYGLSVASGEYVLFFDSDDWLVDTALEKLNDSIEKHPVDLLLFGAQEVCFDENEVERKRVPLIPETLNLNSSTECRGAFCDLIFSSILNVPWNKVFSRKIVDQYSIIFPDTRRAQDAFFCMEYFKHISSLRSIDDILYCYRGNTQAKVWKKFPVDLYKIDIKYDNYLVDIFTEFGIYSGHNRELVDTLFYNSIFRTAGYCRNPKWGFGRAEKIKYIANIIEQPYNIERSKSALALNDTTKRIRKRILESDAKGMLSDIYKTCVFNALYDLYSKSLRKLIRRK